MNQLTPKEKDVVLKFIDGNKVQFSKVSTIISNHKIESDSESEDPFILFLHYLDTDNKDKYIEYKKILAKIANPNGKKYKKDF